MVGATNAAPYGGSTTGGMLPG
jgi:hypothetical protein